MQKYLFQYTKVLHFRSTQILDIRPNNHENLNELLKNKKPANKWQASYFNYSLFFNLTNVITH